VPAWRLRQLAGRPADNLNRTAGDVKSTITKAGCKVADPGSVMFNFQRQVIVVVAAEPGAAVAGQGLSVPGMLQPRLGRQALTCNVQCAMRPCLQGLVVVDGTDEDSVFEAAMEAGVDDIQPVFDEDGVPTSSFKVGQAGGRGPWARLRAVHQQEPQPHVRSEPPQAEGAGRGEGVWKGVQHCARAG
jgi:hypothetical protein